MDSDIFMFNQYVRREFNIEKPCTSSLQQKYYLERIKEGDV